MIGIVSSILFATFVGWQLVNMYKKAKEEKNQAASPAA